MPERCSMEVTSKGGLVSVWVRGPLHCPCVCMKRYQYGSHKPFEGRRATDVGEEASSLPDGEPV